MRHFVEGGAYGAAFHYSSQQHDGGNWGGGDFGGSGPGDVGGGG
jgi:hypothetical protein